LRFPDFFSCLRQEVHGRSDGDDIEFSGGGGSLSGYFDMRGAAVNFFYDIPAGAKFRPYAGIGLGFTRFAARDLALGGFPPTRGSNTLFTYKAMAGVLCALDEKWRVLLGYRFAGMGEQDYETGGIPLRGDDIQTHEMQAGVQFRF
jgi:opacity protein-like surface antigen